MATIDQNSSTLENESVTRVKSVLARSVTSKTYASSQILGKSDKALADYLAATVLHGVVRTEGNFYAYTGKQWEIVPYFEMHQIVQALDRKEVSGTKKPEKLAINKGKLEGVLSFLCQNKDLLDPEFFKNAPTGFNTATGFIRFDDEGKPERSPHSPEHKQRDTMSGIWPKGHGAGHLVREAFGVNFHGDEDCEQKIDLLGEVAAVALLGLGGKKNSQCVVLLGEDGDNGKSTIIDIMTNGMPAGTSCALPPKKWTDDRHIVMLVGKKLNAVAELGSANIIGSEEFKLAITGDKFTARDVFKSAFDFYPRAQHLFATNEMPPFAGGISPPIRKRILILPCERVIPKAERDARVEWLARNEPDAWLAFVVDGASRYLRQGGFTVPESSIEAKAKWTQTADPVLSWIECRVSPVAAAEDRCKSTDVYRDFHLFCHAELQMRDKDIPQPKAFLARIEREFKSRGEGTRIRRSQNNSFRGFYGLRLLDETDDMKAMSDDPSAPRKPTWHPNRSR